MTDANLALPAFNFTTHPSIASFNVPMEIYISSLPAKPEYTFVATGCLTFDYSTPTRILLVQRAAHDSMPNKWEIPGGGCDQEDPSIVHGAARELWEETGLIATRIGPRVGKNHIFHSSSGKVVCRFNFIVEPRTGGAGELEVKLDPNEHQAFVWATEKDVKMKKAGDVELEFTGPMAESAILEAFTLKKDMNADSVGILS
jgi:8-oxo-dGTP pyrophosphatase MutT (NUDIX family)